MRIGLLSPSIYMSPSRYGDMIFAPRELGVSLADGLVARGHDVYFFTSGDVKTHATLISGDMRLVEKNFVESKVAHAQGERAKWASFYTVKRNYELDLTTRCYTMAKEGKLDIIHSYHDTMAHFFEELTGFPTVYTLHDPLPQRETALMYWLLSRFRSHRYVSISNAYRQSDPIGLTFIETIYHGLDITHYPYKETPKEYLAFMGRMVPEKGLDQAIDVARETATPLYVATSSMEENKNIAHYKDIIEPKLAETGLVSFTGFMNGQDKSDFFGDARALLFPIRWDEPFGMVMIEAMACGTPVIAYNRGSVPEIVRDGITGFIVEPEDKGDGGDGGEDQIPWVIKKRGIEGLAEAVARIGEIDRASCRRHVEEHFTIEKMVIAYEAVYRKIYDR